MGKWIDAEWVRDLYADFEQHEGRDDWTTPIANVLAVIEDAPSLDLVRCAECKHWQDNNGGYPTTECRWGHDETPDPDDFCSYGESKENE